MPPINPAVASDDAPDDLRASLMSSYDEAETALSTDSVVEPSNAPVIDATAPGEVATDPLPEEAASPTLKADHPSDPKRYADGSFKPTKAAPDKAAATTDLPSKDTQTQASTAAQTASAPPAGWTAAEKAEWSKLSPVAQAAVSRRETEMTNGGKQWSEEKRRYEGILAPVAEAARARGMDTATGLQTLLAAQRALDTNPVDAIKHIARSYGVDLATLAGTQAANGSPEATQQPDIAALVRQAVQPLLAPIQQRYASEEQARQQSTVDLVTTFATSPGHEHFDAVEAELMAMIPTIRSVNPTWDHAKVLQEAYDRATYANPTTRAALQAAADTAAEAKRVEAAKVRANASRRAGSSVTGAPSGAPATQAKDSLRAELEAAFAGA